MGKTSPTATSASIRTPWKPCYAPSIISRAPSWMSGPVRTLATDVSSSTWTRPVKSVASWEMLSLRRGWSERKGSDRFECCTHGASPSCQLCLKTIGRHRRAGLVKSSQPHSSVTRNRSRSVTPPRWGSERRRTFSALCRSNRTVDLVRADRTTRPGRRYPQRRFGNVVTVGPRRYCQHE